MDQDGAVRRRLLDRKGERPAREPPYVIKACAIATTASVHLSHLPYISYSN